MEKFFNSDNGVMRALSKLFDMGVLTLIYLVFCTILNLFLFIIPWNNFFSLFRILWLLFRHIFFHNYYAVLISAKKIPSYRFIVKKGKTEKQIVDIYAIESLIDAMDISQFSNGVHETIYEKLGAHPMTIDGHLICFI